jgi:diguanylate cyclase (GGDEF)-like protein
MTEPSSKPHFLAQPHQDLAAITPKTLRVLDQLLPDIKLVILEGRAILVDDAFDLAFNNQERDAVLRYLTQSIVERSTDEFDAVIAESKTTRVIHITCVRVTFRKKPAILAFLKDKTEQYHGISDADRLRKLQEAILRINTSALVGDDLRKTLDLILNGAILAFSKAGLGTIFTLNGDHFEVVSSIGYDDEIKRFKLPIEKSFLYCETDGAMDRIAIVNDIQQRYNFIPVKTMIGDETYLHSCMVAPLFYHNTLYGMMSIDSLQRDAFSHSDVSTMEFIRNNVQIAITNQLTFIEKSRQALTDALTGLHNRHYLTEQLNFVFEKAKRFEETFCLAVIDIDDLKKINDRHGHLMGDQVIRVLGLALRQTLRHSDLLVRYGGDEFVAVCFTAQVDQLRHRFEGLSQRLWGSPLHSDEGDVVIRYSVGIAMYPSDATTPEALIALADQRMYAQKRQPGVPHE